MPAQRPVAVSEPCPPPGAGCQSIVIAPVPPATAKVAVPVQGPAQVSGVVVSVAVIGNGARMVKVIVVSHPAASLINTW